MNQDQLNSGHHKRALSEALTKAPINNGDLIGIILKLMRNARHCAKMMLSTRTQADTREWITKVESKIPQIRDIKSANFEERFELIQKIYDGIIIVNVHRADFYDLKQPETN